MQQNEFFSTPAGRIVFRFFFTFVLLFIASFTFPHALLPDIGKYTGFVFEPLCRMLAGLLFEKGKVFTSSIVSDSTGMYLSLLVVAILSAIVTICLWSKKSSDAKWFEWFLVIVRYYLAMQLLAYGCSKLFKWQFYLPEPNTLFTSIGSVSADLLYWSAMGTSRAYTMFLGMAEIAAACFLLFRRTYLLGACVTLAVLMNVVMVNFSFDISVKVYSLFLLSLALFLLLANAKRLSGFFFKNDPVQYAVAAPAYSYNMPRFYLPVKVIVIAFIITDALFMYVKEGNYNDDKAKRPYMHGAYNVDLFVKNADTLAPLTTDPYRWKRMFVHRKGYLIVQDMHDNMQDYQLDCDTVTCQLQLMSYDSVFTILNYQRLNDSLFTVEGFMNNDTLRMDLSKINMKKLALMGKQFHWTIDE